MAAAPGTPKSAANEATPRNGTNPPMKWRAPVNDSARRLSSDASGSGAGRSCRAVPSDPADDGEDETKTIRRAERRNILTSKACVCSSSKYLTEY